MPIGKTALLALLLNVWPQVLFKPACSVDVARWPDGLSTELQCLATVAAISEVSNTIFLVTSVFGPAWFAMPSVSETSSGVCHTRGPHVGLVLEINGRCL